MSTATSVRAHVVTRTETATYLGGVVLGALADTVASLGMPMDYLSSRWGTIESGLKTWMAEGSLSRVTLEFTDRAGAVVAVFEFPVTYKSDGVANAQFVADQASLAAYRAKFKTLPAGCSYAVIASFNGPGTDLGWSSATLGSTAGMQSRTFGTLGVAPHADVSMRYLYRP